jgi:mannose-6-phosphate isomerase-like protein (cupin superfamily)
MKRLSLDEMEGIPVFGSLVWKPVRKTLGVTAFGINAYTAADAGDEVVEDHTESQLGHEEIYAVVTGHATFTVDGEEVDAPAGTLVYLDDPAQQRSAIAKEPNTTVLAIGGRPGRHEISAWEYFFPALPHMAAGDYDTARRLLEEGLREHDAGVVHYQLACVEALSGNKERALAELAIAVGAEDRFREHAAKDEDFASIRDDPRFAELTVAG